MKFVQEYKFSIREGERQIQVSAFDSSGLPNDSLSDTHETNRFFFLFGKTLFLFMFIPTYGKFPSWLHPSVIKYITDEPLEVQDAQMTPLDPPVLNFDWHLDDYLVLLESWFDNVTSDMPNIPPCQAATRFPKHETTGAWDIKKARSTDANQLMHDTRQIVDYIIGIYLWDKRKQHLDAILNGFFSAYSRDTITIFVNLSQQRISRQFANIVKSAKDLIKCFKNLNTEASVFTNLPTDKSTTAEALIGAIYKIEEAENDETDEYTLRDFLIWITGYDQYPPQQLIEIDYVSGSGSRGMFPQAHTCFFQLHLSCMKYVINGPNGSLTANSSLLYEDLKVAIGGQGQSGAAMLGFNAL